MTDPRGHVGWGIEGIEPSVTTKPTTPPAWAAAAAIVAGLASIALSLRLHGIAGWVGWALGFVAIVAGIAYRNITRTRQIEVNFRSRRSFDRLMILGVTLGFIGVVINALIIAQRPVP